MKKALLVLGMLVFLYGTTLSESRNPNESTKSSISVKQIENGKFSIDMLTERSGFANLKLLNDKGKVILTKRFNYDKSFSLPLDLGDLDEGIYKVQLVADEDQFEQEIFYSHLYKEDVAAFISESAENIFKVRVYHENVPVTIKIYDTYGNSLYEETFESAQNFQTKFDLSHLKEQDLKMVIRGKKSCIVQSL